MKLRVPLTALLVLAAITSVRVGVARAGECPNGSGALVPTGLLAGVCVPGDEGMPPQGASGTQVGGEATGANDAGIAGTNGRNHYKWVRDWLDGNYGPYPRPDCHQLPQDNCQDFEQGGVSSPLRCTLANGQPGRPYRDTLVDTDTGEVVSTAEGCYDPVTGISTTGAGASGIGLPPPPPTAAEVLAATNLPRQGLGLSPSGENCAVVGAAAVSATPLPQCTSGQAPGLTGLETLLWVDPPPPAEVSVTAEIRGYSVTTQAHPVRYRWQMGEDGDTASGRNPAGTFETATAGTLGAPAARYRWETKGDYRVSLAVVWEGSYTFTGFGVSRTEALGPVTGEPTVIAYHVVEVRSVPAT